MDFEWDRAKADANEAKHGLSFDSSIDVFFDDDRVTVEDERRDYGEPRFIVTGYSGGQLCVVVFTMRGDVVRLISARRANRRERKRHGDG